MKNKIAVNAKCVSCSGTGLYKGLAERDGYAVVCMSCKGTGKIVRTFSWEEPLPIRPLRDNVHTIIQRNPGIITGDGYDFGGISYGDWYSLDDPKEFPPGKEMRNYTCPAWWYMNLYKRCQECHGRIIGSDYYSNCGLFVEKAECWRLYDEGKIDE